MSYLNLYNSSDIANRIKLQAKINNIKIKDLLTTCELGINTVSKMSNGTDIYSKNLAKIADSLECSVDYLLGRTDNPKVNKSIYEKSLVNNMAINKKNTEANQSTIIPFYIEPASAVTDTRISKDNSSVKYVTIPKTKETARADFMLKVSGDSMKPELFDGDIVLIKQDITILSGEIGVFILNGDSYIKKMGRRELISLNPAYEPIKFSENDNIRCIGKVLGTIEL